MSSIPPLDDHLISAVKRGECILFLGAGVHYPPDDKDPEYGGSYPVAERPPLGSALTKALCDDSQLVSDSDYTAQEKTDIAKSLQRMSLYYEIKKGRPALIKKVKQEVTQNRQPSRAVKALAQLNFPIICTTNYDQLFERALYLANKTPIVSAYSREKYAITKDYPGIAPPVNNPFVFKIHGDIDDASQSIVITDEDYIQFILRMTTGLGQHDPIPRVFRSTFPIWPMLFIGFSLLDYNLRLLFKILAWQVQDPAFSYSVGPYPDGLIRSKYDPPVKFIVRDLWTFVPDLYQAVTGNPMP